MKRYCYIILIVVLFLISNNSYSQSNWSFGLQGGMTQFHSNQGIGISANPEFRPFVRPTWQGKVFGRYEFNKNISTSLGLGWLNFSSGFKFEEYEDSQTVYGAGPQLDLNVDYRLSKLVGDFGLFAGFGVGAAIFPSLKRRVIVPGESEKIIFRYFEIQPDGSESLKSISVSQGSTEYAINHNFVYLKPKIGVDYEFKNRNRAFLQLEYAYKIGEPMVIENYGDLIIDGQSYAQQMTFMGHYTAFQFGYEFKLK